MIARAARIYDPLRLAIVQVLVAGIISGVGSLIFESTPASLGPQIWAGVAFMGIMGTAVAIGIQTSVQGYTTVVHASLIFVLEPVFAAMFGFWLQGDRLGPIALGGAGLIVGGMLIAELGPYVRRRGRARNGNVKRNA
jgi:drug/metabolite transporter (DMT)-like permease